MRIYQNVVGMSTQAFLVKTDRSLGKNLERLSSGRRINRAADDVAGLAISEKMRSQISGYKQAVHNVQASISLIQTAEKALSGIHTALNRMRDLAIQAKNGTMQDVDRQKLQTEFAALKTEIDRIANTTDYNTMKLLNGSHSGGIYFRLDTGNGVGEVIQVKIGASHTVGLGIDELDLNTAADAESSILAIDNAVNTVTKTRSNLGAAQNRLEHTVSSLSITIENLAASESRIRDMDMAEEMSVFSRNQILMQSAMAMMAQANSNAQYVMKLIAG